MKKIALVLFAGAFLALQGCVTANQIAWGENQQPVRSPDLSIDTADINGELLFGNSTSVHLSLLNKTDRTLIIESDLSSYSSGAGRNTTLVPEGTRFIDVGRPLPPMVVPPRASFSRSFFAADAVYWLDAGSLSRWQINDWIPDNTAGASFSFAYQKDGKREFLTFSGIPPKEAPKSTEKAIGAVFVEKKFWNILFVNPIKGRRRELYDLAMAQARGKYGDTVSLKNLRFVGNWHPLSLVLYFSMLGFVEQASLRADVYTGS